MPALRLFGRKWLAASDDLVYPGLFEIFIRMVWLILIAIACFKYYGNTWKCQVGGELARVYLVGEATILGIATLFMLIIVRHSAKGSIMDQQARKYVPPLLTVKILIILPEIAWNILGSLWMFGRNVQCDHEYYTMRVIQSLVFFDWILIGLTIFGLALIFDPLGSLDDRRLETSMKLGKRSKIWLRRFKFLWWMRKDESANETFQHVADLLTSLFGETDLVPSDVVAGCILLRVRQKREIHELRRLNLLSRPKYTSDANVIFANTPSWMSLKNVHYYMKLSLASYGWPFVIYQHACTGCFRLMPNLTCCACFRRTHDNIQGDNCCLCYLAGMKYLSEIKQKDILLASFKNYLCEVPFCVLTDNKAKSIIIVIRGSFSLRDVFTDFAAFGHTFDCPGIPPGSMAHRGMIIGAEVVLKQLNTHQVLEKAFSQNPDYDLTITGHSLGAGVGILLGLFLRPRYPGLRVFAYSTPGLLSREAARVTEEFVLTVGLEDDLVMRLSVDSAKNLRTSLLVTLHACRLPKYRVVLNGFGYALFGVPERDLNKTWADCSEPNSIPRYFNPLLSDVGERSRILQDDIPRRRYSTRRLFNGGRILLIARCKTEQPEGKRKKPKEKERKYEMRWAQPEELTELTVMPRMFLDHFPENIERVIGTLVEQQDDLPFYFDP